VCVCVSFGSHVTDDDTVNMAAAAGLTRPGDYNDRHGTRREGTSGNVPIRIVGRLPAATSGSRRSVRSTPLAAGSMACIHI